MATTTKTKELIKLSEVLKQDPKAVIEQFSKRVELVFGKIDPDYYQSSVKVYHEHHTPDLNKMSVVIKIFGRWTKEIEELVFSLPIFGDGDCPACGSDLEIETDGQGKYTWEEKTCKHCGHFETDEPDWDSMPGGHDDY